MDVTIQKRIIGEVDVIAVVGGEDLNTYMELNEPSTSIVQDAKEFTNINNGIGLFSSRYQISETVKLSSASIDELMTGLISSELTDDGAGYTFGRGFCNNYVPINDPRSCHNK
jgi:hypothetical protein